MGDLVQMRDFKRKEEREAADVRLLQRQRIVPLSDTGPSVGILMGVYDTAPCEMSPAWPNYSAPEKDPA